MRKNIKDYKYIPDPHPQCRVYTIEFVCPVEDCFDETSEYLDGGLEAFRCIGGAEIVDHSFIENGFDEACDILRQRSKSR